MGVFSGPRIEKRYNGFTANFTSPPILTNGQTSMFGGAESAMRSVAVWGAVNLLATLAAELPIDVFSGAREDKKPVPTPSYMYDISGDGYGTPDWVNQAMVSYLLRGNLYGKVAARDSRGGFPTQVPLWHPDDVIGRRDAKTGEAVWRVGGVIQDPDTVWHRRAFPVPGCLLGLSPIAMHAQTIELGHEARRFGINFFVSGGNPTGLLTNQDALDPDQAKTAKARFMAALNGAREPVVLGKGWDWKQISIAPEESMFLETQKYSASECARIFGPGVCEILGYPTGDPLTYATVEGRLLHLLVLTLDPWLTKLEADLSAMLPRPRYVKLNRAALLRTDLLTRYRAHNMAIAGRWKAPSEVRDDEDMAPMTDAQLAELEKFSIAEPDIEETKEKTT